MNKKTRIIFVFSLVLLFAAMAFVAVSAYEPGVYYTVTSKDGEVKSYTTPTDFADNFINANDGDTFTLFRNVQLTRGLYMSSTESEPRTINIDLAGNGLFAKVKLTFFDVGNYTTVNIYSSKENAFIYDTTEDGKLGGGCMFAAGKNARINFGTMLVGDTVYPGSNISTFFSSLANTQKNGTSGIYINGGTHFANISDWKAFVCLRDGDGDIFIKDADLIGVNNPYMLYTDAASKGSLYVENCNIIRADGAKKLLFYQSFGKATIKNCVTNYVLDSGEGYDADSVTLEGRNIFSSAEAPNVPMIGLENAVIANVNQDFAFKNGEKEMRYFGTDGNLVEKKLEMPYVQNVGVVADVSDTIEYTWANGLDTVTEIWYASEEPVFPLRLDGKTVEGKYKPHWTRVEDGRKVTYNGGLSLDFSIKASVEYNGYLCINVYIPADIVTAGYLDFTSILLNGETYGKSLWREVTVDGVNYYRTSTPFIDADKVDEKFVITLGCDFEGKVHAESSYTVSVPKYVSIVSANWDSYPEESRALVEKVARDFSINP